MGTGGAENTTLGEGRGVLQSCGQQTEHKKVRQLGTTKCKVTFNHKKPELMNVTGRRNLHLPPLMFENTTAGCKPAIKNALSNNGFDAHKNSNVHFSSTPLGWGSGVLQSYTADDAERWGRGVLTSWTADDIEPWGRGVLTSWTADDIEPLGRGVLTSWTADDAEP